MPTIIIKNPKSIGISFSTEFVGDRRQFRRVKTVSISGYIFDLTNQMGVEDIVFGIESIISSYLQSSGNVVVSGVDLGQGQLESLSFSEGNDVRVKEYSCSFNFLEEVDLDPFLSDLNFNLFKFIKNINENFSVSESGGLKNISHSIDVSFVEIPVNLSSDPFSSIKSLVLSIFNSSDLLSDLSLISNEVLSINSCSSLFSESYNKFTYDCKFSRTLSFDKALGHSNFTREVFHSLSFDASKTANVTERVEYKTKGVPISCFDSAKSDMMTFFSGAYDRCNAYYSAYKSKFNSSASLGQQFFERSFKFNQNAGNLSYTVSFSDDTFYSKNGAFWSYTLNLEENEKEVKVTEEGQVVGLGSISREKKSERAREFWRGISSGASARANDFYAKFPRMAYCGNTERPLATSKSVTYSNFSGKLSYSFTTSFSSDNVADGTIRKSSSSCTEVEAIKYNSNILVPRSKEFKFIGAGSGPSQVISETTTTFERGAKKGDLQIPGATGGGCSGGVLISDTYSISFSRNSTSRTDRKTYLNVS